MKEKEEEKINKAWNKVRKKKKIEDRRVVDRRDKRLHGEKRAGEDDRGEETTQDNFSRDLRARRLYLYPKLPYYWITPARRKRILQHIFLFRECPTSIPPTQRPGDDMTKGILSDSR